VTTSTVRPVVLRGGREVADPLGIVLGFLGSYRPIDPDEPARWASFGAPDLRRANRGGARISAAEIEAVVERRSAIEGALRSIAPEASLAGSASGVPWTAVQRLFGTFADVRGVGVSKVTKALHPKRPGLIPMLDSVVQAYLADDDPGARTAFDERAVALVRGYKRDLDRNRAALRALRRELARRGFQLSEVRILDMVIWENETG
jgi:Family of unknown function (DUF6308)